VILNETTSDEVIENGWSVFSGPPEEVRMFLEKWKPLSLKAGLYSIRLAGTSETATVQEYLDTFKDV
jgi:hypothetical protein